MFSIVKSLFSPKLRSPVDPDGILVIRGLLERALVERLRDFATVAYANAERQDGNALARESVTTWGGLPLIYVLPSGELAELLEQIERVACRTIGQCKVVPEFSLFRRHAGNSQHLAWHIDADGAATHAQDPCYNFWVPFCAVGDQLPSLQFVLGSHRTMRKIPLFSAPQNHRPDKWVQRRFRHRRIVSPRLDVGDVAIFDHYLLHRTQPIQHAGTRVSGEFRLTARADPAQH